MPSRRYTEQQFRDAVADPEVRTMADLCRAVGIVPRGANYESLRAFADAHEVELDRTLLLRQLGVTRQELAAAADEAASMGQLIRLLEVPDRGETRRKVRRLLGDDAPDASPCEVGPDGTRSRRSYTDEQLRAALAEARNYGQLCDLLGLRPVSGTYRRLREHAATLGLPIPTMWSRPGPIDADGVPRNPRPTAPRAPRFEEAALRVAVEQADCIAQAIRAMGEEPTTTMRGRFARDVRSYGLDTSHFTAEAARGGLARRPLDELLVRGKRTQSSDLRRRLIKEGRCEARCAMCARADWDGQPIPLELDHIDGDRLNNLFENLRLLCPNCHATTPTYRGRNIGRCDEMGTPGRSADPPERGSA